MNNKGFAVSAILYFILIVFLLFLSVTLSSLSSAASLIGNSNKDLTNGTELRVSQIQIDDTSNLIAADATYEDGKHYWTERLETDETIVLNEYLAKINTNNGELIFPKDATKCFKTDYESGNIMGISDTFIKLNTNHNIHLGCDSSSESNMGLFNDQRYMWVIENVTDIIYKEDKTMLSIIDCGKKVDDIADINECITKDVTSIILSDTSDRVNL